MTTPFLLQVHMACLKAGGQRGRRQKPKAFMVHRVKQGETAAGIASSRGLVVADLEQANPGQWLLEHQSMQHGSNQHFSQGCMCRWLAPFTGGLQALSCTGHRCNSDAL